MALGFGLRGGGRFELALALRFGLASGFGFGKCCEVALALGFGLRGVERLELALALQLGLALGFGRGERCQLAAALGRDFCGGFGIALALRFGLASCDGFGLSCELALALCFCSRAVPRLRQRRGPRPEVRVGAALPLRSRVGRLRLRVARWASASAAARAASSAWRWASASSAARSRGGLGIALPLRFGFGGCEGFEFGLALGNGGGAGFDFALVLALGFDFVRDELCGGLGLAPALGFGLALGNGCAGFDFALRARFVFASGVVSRLVVGFALFVGFNCLRVVIDRGFELRFEEQHRRHRRLTGFPRGATAFPTRRADPGYRLMFDDRNVRGIGDGFDLDDRYPFAFRFRLGFRLRLRGRQIRFVVGVFGDPEPPVAPGRQRLGFGLVRGLREAIGGGGSRARLGVVARFGRFDRWGFGLGRRLFRLAATPRIALGAGVRPRPFESSDSSPRSQRARTRARGPARARE